MPDPASPRLPRATWAGLTDAQLLAQCDVDTYRASGPGGQKRNKTSSAVRLRHAPTRVLVIAEESRSQHANKAKALARVRRALYLEWRDPVASLEESSLAAHAELLPATRGGRLVAGPRHPAFWPAAGIALDALVAAAGQLRTAALMLGTTTANLGDFLASEPRLWQAANRARLECGLKPLTAT